MQRPPSILVFERLVYGIIGVGVLSLALGLRALRMLSAFGGPSVGLIVLICLVILGLFGLLGYFAARRASTPAKWIYTGLAGLYVLYGLTHMESGGVVMLLNLIFYGAMAASIFFLFRPDANAWFAQHAGGMAGAPGYPSHGGYPPAGTPAPLPPQAQGWPPQPTPAASWPPAPVPAPSPTAWPAAPQAAAWPPAPPAAEPPADAGWPPQGPAAAEPEPAPAPEPAPPPAASDTVAEPAATAEAAPAASYRPCPYCAEDIRVEAIKCRYCGSQVEPARET